MLSTSLHHKMPHHTTNKLTNCLPAMPFLLPTTTNAEKVTLRPSVPVMFMTVLNYK